jgi:hypothetical protein
MSKVKVSMSVPAIRQDRILSKNVSCEGIVLRYDPPAEEDTHATGCNTAIMFTKISKKDKDTLAEYVKTRLALMAL